MVTIYLTGKKLSFFVAIFCSSFNVGERIHVSRFVENCVLDKTILKLALFGDSDELTDKTFRIIGKKTSVFPDF